MFALDLNNTSRYCYLILLKDLNIGQILEDVY